MSDTAFIAIIGLAFAILVQTGLFVFWLGRMFEMVKSNSKRLDRIEGILNHDREG